MRNYFFQEERKSIHSDIIFKEKSAGRKGEKEHRLF